MADENDEWWYEGHPCGAFISGTHHHGIDCEGIESHGSLCSPCVVAMQTYLAAHLSLSEQIERLAAKAVDLNIKV
jgi:hypothetical protein